MGGRRFHEIKEDGFVVSSQVRRRIYTEEKANVVAAAWGTESLQFVVALYSYFAL